MRVREFALRYGVEPDDVVRAGELLGFDVQDPASEIDPEAFTAAVQSLARPAPVPARRRTTPIGLAAAAALLMVVGAASLVNAIGNPATPADSGADLTSVRSAAAYKTELRTAYAATVGAVAADADFRALASELQEIPVPAAYQAEHARLVAEAERLANLPADETACGETECTDDTLPPELDPAVAAESLQRHIDDVLGTPAP